ncbi:hypothetical protein EBL89_10285 [Cereibacter sphaeroides]|nr:hypothetical protein EBL89_10285 [Cereibacter sphaeroides]AZB59946.1 hypothetical protein EBL88_10225 [Cereibacter sphaeroides]
MTGGRPAGRGQCAPRPKQRNNARGIGLALIAAE